jgi:hypothetical protein
MEEWVGRRLNIGRTADHTESFDQVKVGLFAAVLRMELEDEIACPKCEYGQPIILVHGGSRLPEKR